MNSVSCSILDCPKCQRLLYKVWGGAFLACPFCEVLLKGDGSELDAIPVPTAIPGTCLLASQVVAARDESHRRDAAMADVRRHVASGIIEDTTDEHFRLEVLRLEKEWPDLKDRTAWQNFVKRELGMRFLRMDAIIHRGRLAGDPAS